MANASSSLLDRLFSLHGKTALVTGAGGGIGCALSVALAEAGASVALSDLTAQQLEKPRHLIEELGHQVVALSADLRAVESCRRLVHEAHRGLGRLDVLVNCAAINRRKPIEEVTEEDFEAITDVNLRSIYFLCQSVHPIMREQGGGKIVNVGSINAFYGLGTVSVYGATKGAIVQLTKVMAVKWASDNIQVNCLAPGFTLTPLTKQALWDDEHRRRWLLDRIPAHRMGTPDDMIAAVLLMISEGSSYMTGETIVVDGGFLAGGSWERCAQ